MKKLKALFSFAVTSVCCVSLVGFASCSDGGDYVSFGSYPQTLVTDTAITDQLESLAGSLPISSYSQSWTSYGFYVPYTETAEDGTREVKHDEIEMWYQDISLNDELYRGVYFTEYRPLNYMGGNSSNYSCQDKNGYNTSTLYWFKYESIEWSVLSEETSNGVTYATMLCVDAIDCMSFDVGNLVVNADNDYKNSTIRAWLNATFYDLAFSDSEKALIQLVDVDNGEDTTADQPNQYACENTQDYVWLLSYQDVLNTDYGFDSEPWDASATGGSNYTIYESRRKSPTDYAQCLGVSCEGFFNLFHGNMTCCGWKLRSPAVVGEDDAGTSYVDKYGQVYRGTTAAATIDGVCPVIKVKVENS